MGEVALNPIVVVLATVNSDEAIDSSLEQGISNVAAREALTKAKKIVIKVNPVSYTHLTLPTILLV